MSKHTPGPWTASMGTEDDNERWCVLNEAGYLLATVENGAPGDTLETEEANARLIAAAPDYHANAQRLHNDINGLHATMRATSTEYRASELCRQMDALIAKLAEVKE